MTETAERHALQLLLGALPAWVAWRRPDGSYALVSDGATAISGYPPEAFEADPDLLERLVHRDDRERLSQCAPVQPGVDAQARFRIVARDGAVRWVDYLRRPLRGADGRHQGWLEFLRDVSAEAAAEAAAEAERQRWAEVFEYTKAGIVTGGPDGRLLGLMNPAFAEMHGATPEALEGRPIAELFVPEERATLAEAIAITHERGHHTFRSRHLRADGSSFPVLIEAVALKDEQGDVLRRVVTVQDISAWEAAEQALREREALLRNAHQVAGLGSWRFDLAGETFACSPEVAALYGLAALDGARYEDFRTSFHPDDVARVDAAWAGALQGRGYDLEYRLLRSGEVRWVQEVVAAEHEPGGVEGSLIGTVRDITERRERDELVRRQALALEQSPSIVMLTDARGVIEYVNRRWEEVTGRPREDVIGRETRELKSGLTEPDVYAELWRTISAGETWSGEFHNLRASGETYWERATIAPVRDEGGAITHYFKLAEDVTLTKDLHRRVDHLAFHDPLTELANRALFVDRLEQATTHARHHGQRLAVLLLGVDGFRAINEAWGHVTGDRILRTLGQRLRDVLRGGDTLARFAGDEFAVLLAELDRAEDAALVARRLQAAVRDPIGVGEHEVTLSVCIGVAVAPEDGEHSAGLLQHAAAALHQAKAVGHGQTRFFTGDLDRSARERLELESAFRRALAAGELWVAYQPRFDLRSGRLDGLEALARWDDPQLGSVPPSRFVPLAEATGLIHDLGRVVLESVLAQQRAWAQAGLRLVPVAVNLSAVEFERPDVVQRVRTALATAGAGPHWLEIELTESTAMVDVERTTATIAGLRDLGVAVSIDDFGAGYASLAQLKRLPVRSLKIDRSFLRELGEDPDARPRDAAVVRAIIALGATLGLDVVAEGVEHEAQRSFLTREGCGFAQGFLLGRPLPAEQARAWLESAGVEREHAEQQAAVQEHADLDTTE